MRAITTSEQLLECFGELEPDYFDVSTMPSRRIGFIAFREFPKEIRYVPPLSKSGRPSIVSLLRVTMPNPDDLEQSPRNRVPLLIQARVWPRGQNDRSDSRTKVRWEPIDLDFRDEYWIDPFTSTFETKEGRRITGRAVIDGAFRTHCRTSTLLPRLWFHLRLATRSLIAWSLSLISALIVIILKVFLGQNVQPVDKDFKEAWERTGWFSRIRLLWPLNVEIANDLPKQPNITTELEKEKTLEVFSYKAPRAVVVTFSALALGTYTIAFIYLDKGGGLYRCLKGILVNPMLSLVTGVLGIFVLDYVIPQVGVRTINALQRARVALLWRPISM